mmetsp:Transcript_37677/g.121077  ORF Transcript_37677/g.121077 Transcript_37677/m.121077 type:complete len:322 (+) Transcript_37677:761-1726(+)
MGSSCKGIPEGSSGRERTTCTSRAWPCELVRRAVACVPCGSAGRPASKSSLRSSRRCRPMMRGSPSRKHLRPRSSFEAGMPSSATPAAAVASPPAPFLHRTPASPNLRSTSPIERSSSGDPGWRGDIRRRPSAVPRVRSCSELCFGPAALTARRPSLPQTRRITAARSNRKLKSPNRKTAGGGLSPTERASKSLITRVSARRRQAAKGESRAGWPMGSSPLACPSSSASGAAATAPSTPPGQAASGWLACSAAAGGPCICSARRLHSSWKLCMLSRSKISSRDTPLPPLLAPLSAVHSVVRWSIRQRVSMRPLRDQSSFSG